MSFRNPSELEKGDKISFKRAHPETDKKYTYRQRGIVEGRDGDMLKIRRRHSYVILRVQDLERDQYYYYRGKSLIHRIKSLLGAGSD